MAHYKRQGFEQLSEDRITADAAQDISVHNRILRGSLDYVKVTTTSLLLALRKNAQTTESADTQKHADKLCSEAQLIISRNEIRIQPHQETLGLNESILHLNSADRTHRSREVSETHDQFLHTADVHLSDNREERH